MIKDIMEQLKENTLQTVITKMATELKDGIDDAIEFCSRPIDIKKIDRFEIPGHEDGISTILLAKYFADGENLTLFAIAEAIAEHYIRIEDEDIPTIVMGCIMNYIPSVLHIVNVVFTHEDIFEERNEIQDIIDEMTIDLENISLMIDKVIRKLE